MNQTTTQFQAQPSALPDGVVEAIFGWMERRYLDQWAAKIGTLGAGGRDKAKRTWAEDLARFSDRPDVLRAALEAQKESRFPPSSLDFFHLCRDAVKRLPDKSPALEFKPTAEDRERGLSAARAVANAQKTRDPLLWAKRPASQLALNAVLDLAKTDEQFAGILRDLQEAGVTDGARLL